MAARKFKFVSPGVFLKEIDNSQLPKFPGPVGPAIIGRARKGPAMKPIQVNSYAEFIDIFGEPIPGNQGDDVWRDGNGLLAPAYGPYAAKAYLSADIESPITYIRLLGIQGDDAVEASSAHEGGTATNPSYGESPEAGWHMNKAYGIFLIPSGSSLGGVGAATGMHANSNLQLASRTASLAAIVYGESDYELSMVGRSSTSVMLGSSSHAYDYRTVDGARGGEAFQMSGDKMTLQMKKATAGSKNGFLRDISLNKGKNYIREVINSNPVAVNNHDDKGISYTRAGTLSEIFFVGQTFEQEYSRVKESIGDPDGVSAFVLPLKTSESSDMADYSHEMSSARTGWCFSQDTGNPSFYDYNNMSKLFRLISLHEGESASKELIVAVEDVRVASQGAADPYGTFTISVKRAYGGKIVTVESFPGCNLNPSSQNYLARQVGDQYVGWDPIEKRNKIYGNYPNRSIYIRAEMDKTVDVGAESPDKVPFGYFGPIKPKDITHQVSGAVDRVDGWAAGSIRNMFPEKTPTGGSKASLRIQWPSLRTVKSGSLDGSTYFGASMYKMGSKGVQSDEFDAGTIDYLRPLPAYLRKDEIAGTTSANSQYSYIFSLDELVVSGSNNDTLGDASTAKVVSAYHQSGSRRPIPIAAASATVAITTATAADLDGDNITLSLTSADDLNGGTTTKVYRFNNGGGQANGASISGNIVRVNVGGAGDDDAIAQKLKEAIEASAGHDEKLTVVRSNATLTITQAVNGAQGNTVIPAPANGAANKFTVNGGIIQTAFSGGANEKISYTAATTAGGEKYNGSVEALTELGFDRFWMPLAGGHDGVDIREADPFCNRVLNAGATAGGSSNSYAYATVERAISLLSDPEAVECNVMVAPGVTNTSLTTKLIQTCEARADALGIIDLPDIYVPPHEAKCDNFEARLQTTPLKSAKALKLRALNSSYGCAYYPWVKIKDSENTRDVWVPPSVIALGIFGYTEQAEEVWFAPAGFNRGGLNEGNAGVPVLQVTEQLLSKQRDTLYEANINPIASFVTEGLVVFGQKTLQSTASALDRINVRRLLIFVKKEVSRIASGLLFDQNVPATWNRFTGQVVPFLQSVKTRLGLSDFKVVLDETTTTPDLIDRNILYAKIYLKPARAIEFIAVDFVITRTGASFDD